jgi:hypothetical protein
MKLGHYNESYDLDKVALIISNGFFMLLLGYLVVLFVVSLRDIPFDKREKTPALNPDPGRSDRVIDEIHTVSKMPLI